MFDRPPLARQRRFRVRSFETDKYEIDRRIADGMRGHPPPTLIEQAGNADERRIGHRPESVVGAVLIEWLSVRLTHPSTLKPAVHTKFDSTDAQTLIPFVGLYAPRLEFRVDGYRIGRLRRAQQEVDPHR